MGKINAVKVVIGGLVAGVIINISEFILNVPVLGKDWRAAYEALGKDPRAMDAAIPFYVILGFLLGLAGVWLYAAIRPRFGAGPKTAVIAGLAVWVIGCLLPAIGYGASGIFPSRLMVISVVWALFETIIAMLAGCALYQEKSA